jgi:hypothetical protein
MWKAVLTAPIECLPTESNSPVDGGRYGVQPHSLMLAAIAAILSVRVGPGVFRIWDQPIDRPDLVGRPRPLISGRLARGRAPARQRKNLQQGLLDQSVDDARHAELSDPAVRLGDFNSLDRLRLVGSREQSSRVLTERKYVRAAQDRWAPQPRKSARHAGKTAKIAHSEG